MQSEMEYFTEQWKKLCNSLRVGADKKQQTVSFLIEQYTAPTRHYHTVNHINQVLRKIASLKTEFNDINVAMLAAFFHDVVYDVSKKDNEEQSATIAVEFLDDLCVQKSLIKEVEKIIIATKHHQATQSSDTNLFLDIDMSILAAARTTYLEYAAAVMKEYEKVYTPSEYKKGRLSLFIEPTLALDKIFITDTFSPYEKRARQNLSHEMKLICCLTSSIANPVATHPGTSGTWAAL